MIVKKLTLQNWAIDQSCSGTEVLFKLFEILDMEFMAGNVCKDCTHLIQQLDGLKYQYECLKENLQNRVDKFFDKDINYKACLDTQVWTLTIFSVSFS